MSLDLRGVSLASDGKPIHVSRKHSRLMQIRGFNRELTRYCSSRANLYDQTLGHEKSRSSKEDTA